jgi:GcrA cell cycle regulator
VTRNAVIGKVHRLKLSGRAKPASVGAARAQRAAAGSARPASPSPASRPSMGNGMATMMKSRPDGRWRRWRGMTRVRRR